MKLFSYKTVTLLLFVITNNIYSQIDYNNIKFKQLGLSNGLPNNSINAIEQDNNGTLWFGTRNGLCKYDGYKIKTYIYNTNDSNSISHDFIFKITNDSTNNSLWISTDEGISKYNYQTNKFSRYHIEGNKRNDVSIVITSDKEILAGCSNGIFIYDSNSDKFKSYLLFNKRHVRKIQEDKNNRLWIETKGGLLLYNLKYQKFIPLSKKLFSIKNNIYNIRIINDILIFNTDKSIFIYEITNNKLLNIGKFLNINEYRTCERDKENNLWIGTENGIFVIDKGYNLITHFTPDMDINCGLNDYPIYSIFKDNNNNMWIGTYFGGINYYINDTDNFNIYPLKGKNHISGKAVRQIIRFNNDIYIATEDGGLNIINKNKNIANKNNSLPNYLRFQTNNIHSLFTDTHNNIWIGLFMNGIIRYNPETKSIKHYRNHENGVSAFCIAEDKNKNIWYGGPTGLYYIDTNCSEPTPKKISSNHIFCLTSINDTIWVGTRKNGIHYINTQTKKLSQIKIKSLNNLFITNIYKDKYDNIWIGTNNDGLFKLDNNKKIINIYNKQNSYSNSIKGIIEDQDGNIWVGTDNGLLNIDHVTNNIYLWTKDDGLPINQFNYQSAYLDNNGELYFGTINGMLSFNPQKLKQRIDKFRIIITDFICNNKPFDKDTINVNSLKKITLTNEQAKSITIEFSGMNYQYTNNTQYAMLLEGIDNNWQFIGSQNKIRFSNIPTGNHILKIKASKDGINWDDNGIKILKIKVLPPWWLSTYAYIIYTIIFIIICYIVYIYTKSRIELTIKLKAEHAQRINIEKLNKQKTDFFTYISHDLKTPLTLILSPLQKLTTQNEISNKDKKDIETIYRNANRMHYLIDELLTFSKIEMNQMHISVRKGNIISFLGEISKIFDIVSKEKEIDFTINLEDKGTEVWFSPSKLERIMYNLLSNAFKYSQAGDTVTLSAHLKEENGSTYAVISVKDTGRGIPKEMLDKIFESYYQVEKKDHREGFGLGLSLTRSLIQMHKGDIKVESEVGVGTVFTVTLNVSDNAYTKDEKAIESISQDEIRKYNQRMRDTIELIPDKLVDEEKKNDKETIMIVEDNKEMNEYICDIFKDKYNVMRAFNGEEAYKMLSKRIPDIIVSDIMMPKVDGLEFTRLVKQDVSTSHIPVILLTAKTDEKDHTEGYKCGAEAYIAKPFNAQNLELLIENIQNNRRKVIERFKQAEEMNVTQVTNNPRDEKFMKELVDLIMKNISQEDFGVTEITAEMHISRSLLHTKLKSLTGCSITQFMRTIRMKEARTHLMNGMNVSEASYAVGMSDPNYFTKCFKKEFDITPSEFLKQITAESNKQ